MQPLLKHKIVTKKWLHFCFNALQCDGAKQPIFEYGIFCNR